MPCEKLKKITEYDALLDCPICGADAISPCSIDDPNNENLGIELWLKAHKEREIDD